MAEEKSPAITTAFFCSFIGILAGLIIGLLCAMPISRSSQQEAVKQIRESAVEAEAGEYYLDKDNEKQFRWTTEER